MQGMGPCSTEADVKTLETATFHRSPAARCCSWAARTMASKRVLLGADGKAVFFLELGLNKSLIEAGLATNLK